MTMPPDLATWRSTLFEALKRARVLTDEYQLQLPTERLVREWRASGLLTQDGRQFTGRNILEMLRIRQLRQQDFPLTHIEQELRSLNDEQLWTALTSPPSIHAQPVGIFPAVPNDDLLDETVALLAAGLLRQFRETQQDKVVGVLSNLPRELRQAQAWLARLALRAGEEDRFAALHPLIHFCTRPMREWAPAPLATHPVYAETVLVDVDHLVPTEECDQFAKEGGRIDDLIETRMHRNLMEALATLPEDEQSEVYTLIRRFLAEHSLATQDELQTLLLRPQLSPQLRAFIQQCYENIHPSERRGSVVLRCANCNGPMHPNGRCRLASCRAAHPVSTPGQPVPADTSRVARPELLRFWCDPAQEELRIYRELKAAGIDGVTLYPHLDRCDISIGEHTGVDVKDHLNPRRLAKALNENMGGLRGYDRRILAVADRRAREEQYIERLKENLTGRASKDLLVLSVTDTIALLKRSPDV